ncbi:hypothetical protein LCGC14_1954020 [marine sediment metagenome]|uniref:Right handed beta helix domain-containing protein n=1 Tax=marine sediment metagenome TaxID=412755 RepID=A0A0F9FGI8_9ZZZZ
MKNKKIIISLVGFMFVLLFLGGITSPNALIQDNTPKVSQIVITPDELIDVNFSIYIDGNWSAYVTQYSWASGKGIDKDPYIIEGIHVTNKEQTAHISIMNTEYFIIRNVMVSNYAKPYGHHVFAGIYVGNGQFGLIDNVTIVNASNGISLSNGLNVEDITDNIKIINSNFIGSHNDSDTGLGCAILIHGTNFGYQFGDNFEFKTNVTNVNISNNNILNYYSGVVVYDAEKISVDNNEIGASFDNITDTDVYPIVSDAGVYFVSVKDSEIINNDFFGCKPTLQDSEGVSMSSPEGVSMSSPEEDLVNAFELIDSYNIDIYGNRFFDLEGNLIIPEDLIDPEDPIDPDDTPDDIPDEPNEPDIPDDNPTTISSYQGIFILVSIITIAVIIVKNIKKKK